MVLPGPLSVPHLLPDTPSGNSPQFNPYCATLETPILTPDSPDGELKPKMAAGCSKAILRKDFKKDPQINIIFEEIHSEFYLLVSWYDLPSFLFHLFLLSFLTPLLLHLLPTPSDCVCLPSNSSTSTLRHACTTTLCSLSD